MKQVIGMRAAQAVLLAGALAACDAATLAATTAEMIAAECPSSSALWERLASICFGAKNGQWKFGRRSFRHGGDRTAEFPDRNFVMAFETADLNAIPPQAKIDTKELTEDAHPESHVLTVMTWEEKTLVSIVGKTGKGTDAGAQYLLSKVLWRGKKVEIEKRREFRTPVFNVREVILIPGNRRKRPLAQRKELDLEQWDNERLKRYPKYLNACGFNTIQGMEILAYRVLPPSKKLEKAGLHATTRKNMYRVLKTLADAAHEQGMLVTQYIWASADGFYWDESSRAATDLKKSGERSGQRRPHEPGL